MSGLDYSTIWDGYQNGTDSENSMPTYIRASDNHNYGNGNFAVTDPSTWGTGLSNAGKFLVSATVSGASGLYNSGVTVANWLGADAKEMDVATTLASYDDDLGKYYTQNKEAIDMVGFIGASFVPGLAGTKILNMGQKALRAASSTGMLGANLSKATGLLAPNVQAYTKLAAADIAASNATFSAISGNTLKAITAGYGQAALESAAFEVAVAATMFKSPVLDEMDGWDIAKNIAVGTGVGGVIGGAIQHAVTVGSIKKATKSLNPVEKLFSDTSDIAGISAAQRIVTRTEKLGTMPAAPSVDDILTGEFKGADHLLEGLGEAERRKAAESLATKFARMRSETEISLSLKNRSDFHALVTGEDKEFANQIADTLQGVSSSRMYSNFEHLNEMGRVSTPLKAEAEIEKALKAGIRANKKELIDLDAPLESLPFKVGYVKLHGEGAGDMTFEVPKVLNIADTVGTKEAVLSKVSSYKFEQDKIFDMRNVTDHFEAEARYIWAERNAYTINGMRIGEFDIPMLEKALENKVPFVKIVSSKSGEFEVPHSQLFDFIRTAKEDSAFALLNHPEKKFTSPEIAKITNVRAKFLDGEISYANPADDLFARQMDKSKYVEDLKAKNLLEEAKVNDFSVSPTYVKAAYDTTVLKDIDGNIIQGMAYIKAQQKMYQAGIDNVFAANMPAELTDQFWHPGDDMLLKTNRYGSGPGIATFANGGYHTPESWAEAIGSATSRAQKAFKEKTTATLETHLYKLANKPEAAIEFESINKHIQATGELYGITPNGMGIKPLKVLDWEAAVASGKKDIPYPMLQEGTKEFIPLTTQEARDAWVARTQLTGERTKAFQEIRNAQGLTDMKDPRALRPIRHDPKDYPHFAVVVDPKITGVGHKSMIHAATSKELDDMIAKVPGEFEVYKKSQMNEFFKAHGDFDYEKTLHENYIDASLRSNGVNNPFFVRTDPQKITKSLLEDHIKSDDIFVRELVNAKYEKEFSFLKQIGEQYTNTATSKYLGSFRDIANKTNNPYTNYIKTALNLSQMNEHPLIMGVNNTLDEYATKAFNLISDTFKSAAKVEDLDNVNAMLQKYGVKSAYYDAATQLLANHSAPKGELVKFVSRANSIVSTLVTRLDPLNAINNAVGSTVLYGSETKSFLKAMEGVNPEIAGKLGGLLRTPVPGADALAGKSGDSVMTAGKLMLNAVKNFTSKDAKTLGGESLKEFYKRHGWSTRIVDQFHSVLDDLALQGAESTLVMNDKLKRAFTVSKELAEKGEKFTGNKLAEEFNRFVAADTMRQMTDLGVQAGRITKAEQVAYINTFVNRTQGNILASQRPLMFQGAVGQAIGLFQSYQFNIMQQLFRHVAEGSGKDAAMLLGLQGTMYGMNGMPAFNYLNTHIVGTASGNPQHRDMYDLTYGAAGKSVGDMLMYGLPSNLLRANLYSRGDINPRQLTVVPTNPLDIPFVNATIKLYDNVKGTLGNVANGGNVWQSLLQGIEHNGLSRPLAGIAQTAQVINNGAVFATDNKGAISSANDLFAWSTAVRLSGGKPFDAAIANDASFRISAYQAADRQKKDALAKTIKTAVIGKEEVDAEQVASFAEKYAALGGTQTEFNKYMLKQIKEANTVKANKIVESLKHPYNQKMQQIMGGDELLDGRSF